MDLAGRGRCVLCGWETLRGFPGSGQICEVELRFCMFVTTYSALGNTCVMILSKTCGSLKSSHEEKGWVLFKVTVVLQDTLQQARRVPVRRFAPHVGLALVGKARP